VAIFLTLVFITFIYLSEADHTNLVFQYLN